MVETIIHIPLLRSFAFRYSSSASAVYAIRYRDTVVCLSLCQTG